MALPIVESMSTEEKRWYAYAIAGAICADGHLDSTEHLYLKEAITFLEDSQEINKLIGLVKTRKLPDPYPIQLEKKLAFEVLKHIAGLLIVDGKLTESERNFFKNAGNAINFPKKVIETILKFSYERLDAKRPSAKAYFQDSDYTVKIVDLSETICVFSNEKPVSPHTRIEFDFNPSQIEENEENIYRTIVGQVIGARHSKIDTSFIIRAEFRERVREEHGIFQILNPEQYKKENKKAKLETTNNSLFGKFVSCFVCNRKEIPFWSLKAKSMATQLNTVGVITYTKALPGKDFCDYNMIRVAVCPKCYFASNDILYFKSEDNPLCPFELDNFKEKWMRQPVQRKGNNTDEYDIFGRTNQKAIETYKYAILTHKQISNIESGDENLRKVLSLLMIQAELYMNTHDRKLAEKNLKQVINMLTPVFSEMEGAPIIRAATLLFFIHLYFKDAQEINNYMNFLKEFDPNEKLDPKSDESFALKKALNLTEQAYKERDNYGHDKVKTFQLNKV